MTELWVATKKGLFSFETDGTRSDRLGADFLGDPVTAVLPNGGDVYAAIGHGHFGSKLHVRRQPGRDWAALEAPAYPPKPEGLEDIDPMRKQPVPWSVQQIWILEAGEPGELWCGTIPGGLFHSRDAGQSFQLCLGLWNHPARRKWFGGGYDFPGIHSICVDPRNPDRVGVAVSCGGVWLSSDRGASWQAGQGMRAAYMPPEQADDPEIQDPHRMVQCPGAPDKLWIQHHNGIVRSTDAGRSWRELQAEPSSFGFAVAVHPQDPETAWFAPAKKDECRIPVEARFGVMRTRDGGQSFQFLRRGLPEEPAYHLVYRHGLDVDATGRLLAMGSTTGSLWVSADGGDSFCRVSAELPPIFAVRWAQGAR